VGKGGVLKRTDEQRYRDLAITAHLYLQGWYQQEIADYINNRADPDRDYELSQQNISYDLKTIRDAWLDSAMVDLDARKAKELAKIDMLEREYWKAWRESMKDEETVRVESDDDGTGRRVETRKGNVGDPRFLAGIQKCIDRRIELFGLDAPRRIESEHRVGVVHAVLDMTGIDDRELEQLERLLSKALPDAGAAREGQPESDNVHEDDILEVPAREST